MTKTSSFLFSSLLLMSLSNLQAEPQCPGNAASVRYHSLGHSQITIPVTINQTGPYEFMVDTGSQLTIVDPALASELRLEPVASIGLLAVSSNSQAQIVLPDTLEAGSHAVSKLAVAVNGLEQIQAMNPRVRGILGGNFLARFDLLIDYAHKMVCFDESGQMRQALAGEHIPLEAQADRQSDMPFTQPYLVSAHLAGTGNHNSLLRLDSGAAAPLVYKDYGDSPSWIPGRPTATSKSAGKGTQSFKILKPEDVQIGKTWLRQVVFLTPAGRSAVKPGQDGLLPTALFHRVFLSYAEHFAIFDPK